MKYRKKPVVIDGWSVNSLIKIFKSGIDALPECIKDANIKGQLIFTDSDKILINTLEGTMEALSDDMIIRGVQGELYPCKPDIFKDTYDPV